jgi:hypothetical protein
MISSGQCGIRGFELLAAKCIDRIVIPLLLAST